MNQLKLEPGMRYAWRNRAGQRCNGTFVHYAIIGGAPVAIFVNVTPRISDWDSATEIAVGLVGITEIRKIDVTSI